jgi:hypothetical protein
MERREFLNNSAKLIGLGLTVPVIASALSSCSCEDYIVKESQFTGAKVNIDFNNAKDDIGRLFSEWLIGPDYVGWGMAKSFGKYNYGIPLIIVRILADSDPADPIKDAYNFVCFSAMCTHDHCIIHNFQSLPSGPGTTINCSNCHGSQFDQFNHAAVVKGPAPQPLREFTCTWNSISLILTIEF